MSEHSGPSRLSQVSDGPPLRARDGHVSSAWYCWRCVRHDDPTSSGQSDGFGRDMVWNFAAATAV